MERSHAWVPSDEWLSTTRTSGTGSGVYLAIPASIDWRNGREFQVAVMMVTPGSVPEPRARLRHIRAAWRASALWVRVLIHAAWSLMIDFSIRYLPAETALDRADAERLLTRWCVPERRVLVQRR